jgi:hypothetical protein
VPKPKIIFLIPLLVRPRHARLSSERILRLHLKTFASLQSSEFGNWIVSLKASPSLGRQYAYSVLLMPPLTNIIEAPLRRLGEYNVDCLKASSRRPKDLIALPELEAIQEAQTIENQPES